MPLLQILEVLIVVGVLLWLVNRFIPMQGSIKSILNGVVIIAVVLWLPNVFGLFHSLSRVHVGTLLIPCRYGVLLGCFGAGSIGGALIMQRLRARFSTESVDQKD